jgi:hypothetical protein
MRLEATLRREGEPRQNILGRECFAERCSQSRKRSQSPGEKLTLAVFLQEQSPLESVLKGYRVSMEEA